MILPLETVRVKVLEGCELVLSTNCKMVKCSWILVLVVELQRIGVPRSTKTLRLLHIRFDSLTDYLILTLSHRYVKVALRVSSNDNIIPLSANHDFSRNARVKLSALPHYISRWLFHL